MKTVLMRLGLSGYQITPVYFREFADSPDWETTGTILKEIAVEFGRYNIPVIFVLLPAIYQVQPETFLEYAAGFGIDPSTIDLDQPNRILSRALEKAGLMSVDTTPVLKEAAARGEVLYGAVDPHFTARGHRIVAELLQSPVEKVLSR